MGNAATETAAAVDLGSNSFHMIIAEVQGERLKVVDKLREMVRLAGGLDERGRLSDEIMVRAMECLRRFGQRLRDLPAGCVRAVGTNTLRRARNSAIFLARAKEALGHPIDIISGHEEARLIYLGVAHTLEDDGKRRLVVDIGGGSTEIIIGRRFEPQYMESLHMGCVSLSQRFFPDGDISDTAMRRARLAAMQELETVSTTYRRLGWDSEIGASGTILAVQEIVREAGWSKNTITADALQKLIAAMIEAGNIHKTRLKGLSEERAPVFVGGAAILSAVFEAMGMESMTVADGALREGLIHDLIGRLHQHDVRENTVTALGARYQIDEGQAKRVRKVCLAFFDQIAAMWKLDSEEYRRLLSWAAWLHELGLSVSHSQYQKHGGYLLMHLDMPGFSRGEKERLAFLVRAHRRKFPLAELQSLDERQTRDLKRLCAVLRLAVVLQRSRTDTAPPKWELAAEDETLKLRFPDGWLETHPLTLADLEQEAEYLRPAEIKLKYK
ncbi:MAG TPA: exopolyphosphatase [Gammaproteobacteria bacterium]|nr:exopolyphosphatase [Gammaproteobacteria bacterium]